MSFLEKKTLRNEEIIIDKMNEVKVSRIGQDKYISNILKENLNITVKVIYIDDTETSKTTQKFVTIFEYFRDQIVRLIIFLILIVIFHFLIAIFQ